jgi:hypothetical protein
VPDRFIESISLSNRTLERVKKGSSIFEDASYRESAQQKSLPFLQHPKLKQNLKHFLKLSVSNQTYSPALSEENRLSVARLINQSPDLEKPQPFPLSNVELELSSELTKFE